MGELAENREDAGGKAPALGLMSISILIFADELLPSGPYQRGHDARTCGLSVMYLNEQIVYQGTNPRFRCPGASNIVADRIPARQSGACPARRRTADKRFSDFEHGVFGKQLGALGAIPGANIQRIGVDEIGNGSTGS